MSYGAAAALQAAVHARLASDPALAALVGTAIHDALPPGSAPDTWVAIGPEEVRDRSDATGAGAEHDFTVTVMTGRAGFQAAKAAAVAVSDALTRGAPLVLARGRVVGLWFLAARASRERDGTRRIDLRFRARIED